MKDHIIRASLCSHVLYYGDALTPSWPIPLAVARILTRQSTLYLRVCPQGITLNLHSTDLTDRLDAHYLLL